MTSTISLMDINVPNVSAVEDKNANLVPAVVLKTMETVSSKVPNIINGKIINIIDITADDITLENFQVINHEKTTLNINTNEIVNISNTSNTNEDVPTKFSRIFTKLLDNDVQIICVRTNIQSKSIEFITISDDSDDKNTSNQQSIKKLNSFRSVSELHDISKSGKSRASYYRHLSKRNRKWKGKNKTKFENVGFIIDERKTSTNSMNPIMFEQKAVNFNKPHVSSTVTTLHNRKRKREEEKIFDNLTDNSGTLIFDKKLLLKNPPYDLEQKAVKMSKLQLFSTVATSSTNRKLRPIIIDGLNIGHAHGLGTFSVKGIEICIQFFTDRGHKDVIALIPIHRQGPPGSKRKNMLNKLYNKGQVCFTPSRKIHNLRMTCHDDRIILEYANKCNGVVVSNDNYRDLYDENEAFKEIIENRLVMVMFVKNDIIVPEDQYNRRPNILFLSDILCFPE
ncbi:hypothetical protein QTP88_011576 [Uroleucon formosanum]